MIPATSLQALDTEPVGEAPKHPPAVLCRVLYLFCFSTCFESYDPFGLSGIMTMAKMLGIILFALALYYKDICFRLKPVTLYPWLWILFWDIVVTIYYASDLQSGIRALLGPGLTLLQCIGLFWICCNLFTFPKVAMRALWYFAASSILMSVLLGIGIGITEIPDLRGAPRVTFLGTNVNALGLWAACAGLILFGVVFENYGHWGSRRSFLLLFLPSLFAVLAKTGSRGSLATIAVSLPMFIFSKKSISKKILLLFALMVSFAVLAFYVSQSEIMLLRWQKTIERGDIADRDLLWKASWELIMEKPLTGWGLSEGPRLIVFKIWRIYAGGVDPHNVFMWMLLTSGLAGFIPFLYILARISKAALDARSGYWGVLPLALLMAILFNMAKGGGFYMMKMLWVFLAFIVTLPLDLKSQLDDKQ